MILMRRKGPRDQAGKRLDKVRDRVRMPLAAAVINNLGDIESFIRDGQSIDRRQGIR